MKIDEMTNQPNVQLVVNKADLKELFLEWQDQYQPQPTAEEEVYLTPDEVAKQYRVSKVTLWRNAKNGAWPSPIKIGRKALYRKSEIEAVLNPNKMKG